MYKIKINMPGWEMFNGEMSGVHFENGISVREVTLIEANRIGANLSVIRIDTEAQVGASTEIFGNIPAAPVFVPDREHEVIEEKPIVETKEVVEETPKVIYTKEDLETIADKEGIKGIRAIAKDYDVKGVQIAQLISGILAAQGM